MSPLRPFRRRGTGGRTRPIRVAIAGAGSIAVVHALAARSIGWDVTAVASAGGRSARHLAGQVDARRVRPEDLPAGADVLVVATPAPSHAELARRGLDAGAHVLVEKPLATTLADADRLVVAAEHRPDHARVAENLLHAPAWQRWRQERPTLGTLGHLSARALQPSPDWGHFTGPLHHGGVLLDLGPHPVALVLEAAGTTPRGVRARLASRRADGADDRARLEIDFDTGLVATVDVQWGASATAWDVQAAGPDGSLRFEVLPHLELARDGRPLVLGRRHEGADQRLEELGYLDQLLDLVGSPTTGQDLGAARAVLEVICAAYASAGRDGGTVGLPFTGDREATPMQLWRG